MVGFRRNVLKTICIFGVMGVYACTAAPTDRQTPNPGTLTNGQNTSDTSNTLSKKVGEIFALTIASNPTTGYQWGLQEPLDEKIVKLESNVFQAPGAGSPPGTGGQEVWTFKAVGKGQTRISLKYFRSFEPPETPPVQQKAVLLQVTD